MLAFDFGSRATQGAREYQEDSSAVHPVKVTSSGAGKEQMCSELVAVLADGMGGHAGGALASRLICDQFIATFGESEGAIDARLSQSLAAANEAIAEKVASDPVLCGMGSTMIGVAFGSAGVEWISVGDSPLMLFRRGEVAMLNEDHSLAPELDRLAAAGQITQEQARQDPRRHMLRSAVTGEDLDLIDQSRQPLVLEDGDYVVLASDGIHSLEINEVERIIAAYASDGAEAVAGALVRSVDALREPHQDNATIVAVRAVEV
ncbi:MAG: protein phosphatase 2C domain-containing protein [Alphaproteobacteria bacterium]|nr:protein phosphatase 2C domain-containing protein [Alphaproteobacteria bacterium]